MESTASSARSVRRAHVRLRLVVLALTAMAIAGACERGAVGPVLPQVGSLEIVSGHLQHGTAGDALMQPLVVRVRDTKGALMPGVEVSWRVVSGEGTITAIKQVTDDSGRASASWTLGRIIGDQSSLASAQGVSSKPVQMSSVGAKSTLFTAHAHARDEPLNGDEIRLLSLETFDGSGQVVHPDIVHVPQPGPDRRYLFITPYPGGSATFENPSEFSGFTGISWWIPSGVKNPLELPTAPGYLSDPDAVYVSETNELWLYYREVRDSNIVKLARSSDGVKWSDPIRVVAAANHDIVSPTVVRLSPTDWRMWSVRSGAPGCAAVTTTVELRRSTDGIAWSPPTTVDLPQPPGMSAWHIDVEYIPSRGEFWALYNVKGPGGCVTPALFLATSTDGETWTTYPAPVLSRNAIPAFQDVVYRSTLEYLPNSDDVMFWYSGARYEGGSYTWRAAVQRRDRAALFADLNKTSSMTALRVSKSPRFNVVP